MQYFLPMWNACGVTTLPVLCKFMTWLHSFPRLQTFYQSFQNVSVFFWSTKGAFHVNVKGKKVRRVHFNMAHIEIKRKVPQVNQNTCVIAHVVTKAHKLYQRKLYLWPLFWLTVNATNLPNMTFTFRNYGPFVLCFYM